MIRRIVAYIIIFIMVILLTGCWGKTELNEIGIVTVTGIDLEPDGNIRITVMSVQPEGSATSMSTRSDTWIGTATGKNLMDASKDLNSIAMKHLTWIHNTVIIIGQDAAKQRMDEVIDFFSRNREVRFSSYILVAQDTAFAILQAPADIQNNLPKEIDGMINNAPEWSKSYVAKAKDFLVAHAESCGDYITGKIFATYEKRTTFSAPRQEYEKLDLMGKEIPIVNIEGSAIFKEGKMLGWLDTEETRGYLWITGDIKTGAIVTFMKDGNISFENYFNKTSVKLEINGEEITFLVKVDTRGTLVEQTTSHNIRQQQTIQLLEKEFSDAIKKEMEASAEKIQKEYKSDVFRFDSLLHKKAPALWKKICKDWNGKYFPRVKIQYEVNVTIERTGKLLKSVYR